MMAEVANWNRQPLPGDFGLTTIAGLAGRGVDLGQRLLGAGARSRYRHAFLVLDGARVLEAEPDGARIVPLSTYTHSRVTFSHWSLGDNQRAAIVEAGRALEGAPYAWLDYAAIGLHQLGFGTSVLRKRIEDSGHLICSQLVDLAYQRAGVQLFDDGRWPGYVPPADLALCLVGVHGRWSGRWPAL